MERNLKENMMSFARKCFNSGYRVEGSSMVEADEAHLEAAIDMGRDFALYLDASREFFDEWADDVFDVYTKTYEGPFEVDGVKYDPNANPPDEDVPDGREGRLGVGLRGGAPGVGEDRGGTKGAEVAGGEPPCGRERDVREVRGEI